MRNNLRHWILNAQLSELITTSARVIQLLELQLQVGNTNSNSVVVRLFVLSCTRKF